MLLAVAVMVVIAPGYWEYQQIRWRTKLEPDRIEAGMTGMLAATKATEKILGHGNLTAEDFRQVSAETFEYLRKMAEYNELSMILRVRYIDLLLEDPTGKQLKEVLFRQLVDDVAAQLQTTSPTADSVRNRAYEFALAEPEFETLLLERIGRLENLRISTEQMEVIKEEQRELTERANGKR